jgi:hypothetical protein
MDIIALSEYPREKYSAYWEIAIDRATSMWSARIYDYATNTVMVAQTAVAPSYEVARSASQTWVKSQMELFARPSGGNP